MKQLSILSILIIIIVIPRRSDAQIKVPSSSRSREAISRVRSILESELTESGFRYGAPIFLRIFKKTKELEVWLKDEEEFRHFKTYTICTYGGGSLGPKVQQGDGQAPEGFYFVTPQRMNPTSFFHLSFNIGYPNTYDRTHGRTGSALMVHGNCVSIGCYAMTNAGIEEIYALTDNAFRNGQRFFRVHIFPFRMSNANMNKYSTSEWIRFWENLKEGYDFFEENGHIPPNINVRANQYVFEAS